MVSYRKEIPSSLDLLPLGERFGDKNQARMRARPNAKFSHIKSSIDHGKKEKKIGHVDPRDANRLTRRKGENFGRIAANTLANYIVEGRASQKLSRDLDDIQVLRNGRYPTRLPPAETNQPKIVLLDLRSTAEYLDGHIRNAISFPAENIQRDSVFAQLSVYKNKADKLIVVYHDDERHGILQSRIIFEKGFDNIYLLSGGICIFEQDYADLIDKPTAQKTQARNAPQSEVSNKQAAGEMVAASAQQSPSNLPMSNVQAGVLPQSRGQSARGPSTARSGRSQRQHLKVQIR